MEPRERAALKNATPKQLRCDGSVRAAPKLVKQFLDATIRANPARYIRVNDGRWRGRAVEIG